MKIFSDDRRTGYIRVIYIYLLLAVATIVAGLALRLVPLGLPFELTKWGGSVLWAWMVYWLFAAVLPFRRPATVALTACVFAALVELSRLYHSPGLDAFRLTLAGKLLLGRVFSRWHFAVYWVAIGIAAMADRAFLELSRNCRNSESLGLRRLRKKA